MDDDLKARRAALRASIRRDRTEDRIAAAERERWSAERERWSAERERWAAAKKARSPVPGHDPKRQIEPPPMSWFGPNPPTSPQREHEPERDRD